MAASLPQQKHILLVTDLAAIGRAAALVALPVLNLSGQTVSLLPTAYFSAHTGGLGQVHRRDLGEDLEASILHWQTLGLRFDVVFLSYLAGERQLEVLETHLDSLLSPGGVLYVDPVMGDHGKPYAFCDQGLVAGFRRLCARADLIFPNHTEAALLLGLPLQAGHEPSRPSQEALKSLGAKATVLTGHTRGSEEIGLLLYQGANLPAYETFRKRWPGAYPGTGDLLSAAMVASLIKGATLERSAELACDFLDAALEHTALLGAEPRFGLAFEPCLRGLLTALNSIPQSVGGPV